MRSVPRDSSSTSRAARSSTPPRSSTALRDGRIAGAGLDVIEGEPAVPPDFWTWTRWCLSPHVGGYSPEAIRSMMHKVRANLDAHFAGQPVLSPVPA